MTAPSTTHRRSIHRLCTLALAAVLAGCGGGLDESGPSAQALPESAEVPDQEAMSAFADWSLELQQQTALGTLTGLPEAESEAPQQLPAESEPGPDMTAQALRVAPARSAMFGGLPASSLWLPQDIRPSSTCQAAYVPPAWLRSGRPASPSAPLLLNAADLAPLKRQFAAGPFLRRHDFAPGSPGEMSRVLSSAGRFLSAGEPKLSASNAESMRPRHGSLARDAAFSYTVYPDPVVLNAVRQYLREQIALPFNDFASALCVRQANGSVRDAWFGEAAWLARFVVTYDAVRGDLGAQERIDTELFIRRNAYFLAAQLDYGLGFLFPQRTLGVYTSRGASAAAKRPEEAYLSDRVDTNGDCRIDGGDAPARQWIHAYVGSDGSLGPRLSVLSQWYNNRRSTSAMAIGLAGVLLNDSELTVRAKRYFFEWLAYGVYSDGSEGEYARNGDYCIPNQGLIYAASNIQGAVLLGDVLARRGDTSLFSFSTREGLFGSEVSSPAQGAKSLATVVRAQIELTNRNRNWYRYTGVGTSPANNNTHLGRVDARYMGTGSSVDNFHQVGLLLGARYFQGVPVRELILRDPKVSKLAWPGSTGRNVATGFGSQVGAWTDVFNLYPSALLIRAD